MDGNNAACEVVKKKIPDKELYEAEKCVELEEEPPDEEVEIDIEIGSVLVFFLLYDMDQAAEDESCQCHGQAQHAAQ